MPPGAFKYAGHLRSGAPPGTLGAANMTIIQQALATVPAHLPTIRIAVERLTLAKRRWRGVAEDGREFGFDLDTPLRDADAVWAGDAACYLIAQKYEPVLEVRSAEFGVRSSDAARLGWMIGNLHFQIEIADDIIRVMDDPAVRQMLAREGIAFAACKRIFHPLAGGHRH